MIKQFKYLILISLIFLGSCSFYVSSKIKMSDLASPENKVVGANAKIYLIGSCNSSYINEITRKFKSVGIDARFSQCTNKLDETDDYANFSVPVEIVKNNSTPQNATKLFYFQYINDVFFIRTAKTFDFVHEKDKILFSEISFSFVNDTTDNVKIIPYMLFVSKQPVKANILTVKPDKQVDLELSDVGRRLLEQSDIKYPVFQIVK